MICFCLISPRRKMRSLHLLPFLFSMYFPTTFLFLLNLKVNSLSISNSTEWYEGCGNYFSCGNLSNVGYPFWGGSRPKDCGQPELELSCEDNATPVIEIMDLKYRVLHINQTSRIVGLARDDLEQGICLDEFTSTVMDSNLFEYVNGTQNITVLYGCPFPYETIPNMFSCKVSGSNDSVAYPLDGDVGPNFCTYSILIPVTGYSPDVDQGFSQIVNKGFEVKYKLDVGGVCAQCQASKGRCGFDISKNRTSCLCPNGSVNSPCAKSMLESKSPGFALKTYPPAGHALTKSQIAMLASFSATGIGTLIILLVLIIRRTIKRKSVSHVSQPKTKQEVEAFLNSCRIYGPKRYSYSDLKRITNSFKEKLGEGGYGTLYRGKLHDGNLVAVKILKKSKGHVTEFINEVASIGTTNHRNIVTLSGFCYEGEKRALVYDFMPNGSLDKYIYGQNNNESLAWEKLFHISIGIARGLEYLHQGCNTRILHFDIKPHNILLDDNFCPKISDFGLARTFEEKQSAISMSGARGTIGYIAPEVFFKSFGGVSHK